MTYYILLENDTELDCVNDTNTLGESSFGIFWASRGLSALINIAEKEPDLLNSLVIKTDTGKTMNVQEFMHDIDKLEVRMEK